MRLWEGDPKNTKFVNFTCGWFKMVKMSYVISPLVGAVGEGWVGVKDPFEDGDFFGLVGPDATDLVVNQLSSDLP